MFQITYSSIATDRQGRAIARLFKGTDTRHETKHNAFQTYNELLDLMRVVAYTTAGEVYGVLSLLNLEVAKIERTDIVCSEEPDENA